jgi:hypothetical protein
MLFAFMLRLILAQRRRSSLLMLLGLSRTMVRTQKLVQSTSTCHSKSSSKNEATAVNPKALTSAYDAGVVSWHGGFKDTAQFGAALYET